MIKLQPVPPSMALEALLIPDNLTDLFYWISQNDKIIRIFPNFPTKLYTARIDPLKFGEHLLRRKFVNFGILRC